MPTLGRDIGDNSDNLGDNNLKKWQGFFIPALQQIQKLTHPNLIAKQDGLIYVESLIVRLLCQLISPVNSVGPATLHTTLDVEERIRRLFPDPLDKESIAKAKETLSALKNVKKYKAVSIGSNDRSPLKSPVDKFHQMLGSREVLGYKIDIQVSQYILAILEYIATDILQLSGHYVGNMTHTEITSQDIRVAMCADKMLMHIFYKDEDDADGPPLSAGFYHHQPFFEDLLNYDSEYGNVGNRNGLVYLEAVKEFIQEERQFIRELNLIIKVFRDPLMQVLSFNDLETIFSNIDDILEFSNNFLGSLEDAVEVADEEDCPAVGACFYETAECCEYECFNTYAQKMLSCQMADEGCCSCSGRCHLNKLLGTPGLYSRIEKIFLKNGPGMMAALRYVLPRLLLYPIYHCFSYFRAIENFKNLTPSEEDKCSFEQAESQWISLKIILEKYLIRNRNGEGCFLRLYGRTNRAVARSKMKDIQQSIDNWPGDKEIWHLCNEFIREGVLLKVSNASQPLRHRSSPFTERRAFLFDGLLVLCKANNKARIGVTGRDNSQYEWRFKERFFIRNIEIIDRELPLSGSNNTGENSPGFSSSEQSFSLNTLTSGSSLMSLSSNVSCATNVENSIYAFEITQRNQNHIVLAAKTPEEKDLWMSQLILLNMRSMLERSLDARLSDEAKKHPLQLPHPSQYRFAIEDNDSNILLEENRSNPNVPLIKGATLLKLVERLTYHKYGDPVLVRTFLTTYRSFCTPTELLKLLIERFEIPEPDFRSCMQAIHYANEELSSPTSICPPTHSESGGDELTEASPPQTGPTSPTSPTASINLTPSDLKMFFEEQDEQCQKDYREMLKRFRKEYAQPVQFRVLNVLRHWIDNHYYDFERDIQLLQILTDFLDKNERDAHKCISKWCEHIKKKVTERNKAKESPVLTFDSVPPPIEWWIANPSNSEDVYNLMTLHPVEVARQLTLLEFDLYRAVKPFELIGQEGQSVVWTKKDKQKTSPNLLKMIKQNSIITYYLEKCIIETENLDERVALVNRILEIMVALMELNNFNGVFEIVSAFASAPVHRLEHTKNAIERSKLKKALDEAKELTNDHLKKYNEKLRSINPPCVPFFGQFLSNIVFLEEGNPEYLNSPPNAENVSLHDSNLLLDDVNEKLINFYKKRRVAETISMIQQYQNQPYCFTVEPSIRNFLENLDPFGDMDVPKMDDYLFYKSLEIEPRNSNRSTLKFPRRWPEKYIKQLPKQRNNRFQITISHLSHSHQGSSSNSGHSNADPDTVSLQQQQSPSTPLTPLATPHSADTVFAPVMIGGGSGSCNSPTSSVSFFPLGPVPSARSTVNSSNNSSSQAPPSTPCSVQSFSPLSSDFPPPLPPRNLLPPPLPPRRRLGEPLTPISPRNSQSLFSTLPAQPSPPLPPLGLLSSKQSTTPISSPSSASSPVPELPPKTYRLSNACR